MNSKHKLNTNPEVDPSSISLLPKDNIQTNYHFRWRLGFIPQWKKRVIKVIYSVHNGILQVGFEKPDNTHFIGQHSAEQWFYGPIQVSPHVGKYVMNITRKVQHHIFCKTCGIKHSAEELTFVGTKDMFGEDKSISVEFTEKCPTCDKIRIVEIYE